MGSSTCEIKLISFISVPSIFCTVRGYSPKVYAIFLLPHLLDFGKLSGVKAVSPDSVTKAVNPDKVTKAVSSASVTKAVNPDKY
jgi:hypothetical protein